MNVISKYVTAASIVGSAAVLAMAGLHAPAARADDARTTVQVKVADVDARTQAGAQVVFARLERASAEVCGEDYEGVAPLTTILALNRCEQSAIAPAVLRINSAPLTALYHRHVEAPPGIVSVGPISAD